MPKFEVIREHQGDRFYRVGEMREGSASDFAHLIPNVLRLVEGEKADPAPLNKAEPEPENKAEPAAPANKAKPRRKAK